MLWVGEVEDAESIEELITSATTTGDPVLDFENLDINIASGLKNDPYRKLQETSQHSRRQSSIREDITYSQGDCLDDLRLHQHSWRQ